MADTVHPIPLAPPLPLGSRPSQRVAIAVFWGFMTALIWGGWPAFTRLSVTQSIAPEDLVALRYAVGGLILLPVLVSQARIMPPSGWREGIWLALFQGAPLALLVTIGVRYAPASHMAALSPGLLPLFAALLSFWFLREPVSTARGWVLG